MPVWSGIAEAVVGGPATSNRTRIQAVTELCYYVGGDDDADARTRAGTAWDRAVRAFNEVAWRFNRMSTTFAIPADFNASGEAALPDDFRDAVRVMLLNSDGATVDWIDYVPWKEWTIDEPYQVPSPGAQGVNLYTLRNEHEDRTIIIDPIPDQTATYTYPTLQLHYHRRIELATADDATLNTPMEVEEAIFALALAKFIKMMKGGNEAKDFEADAIARRLEVEREWRDFGDFHLC